MTHEINAPAAAKWGVATTDATANATPAAADSPCCGDSSACARAGTDPVAAAAARRKIERAVETLELKSMVQRKIGMRLGELQELYARQSGYYSEACENVERAAAELERLRKGTT